MYEVMIALSGKELFYSLLTLCNVDIHSHLRCTVHKHVSSIVFLLKSDQNIYQSIKFFFIITRRLLYLCGNLSIAIFIFFFYFI